MFGFTEVTPVTGNGGVFGLNQNAKLGKFEYNEEGYIDFSVKIGEREYGRRFYPITKVYVDGVESTDTNSEAYKKAFEKDMNFLTGHISDIVKTFVPVEVIKQALVVPPATFKDYAVIMTSLISRVPNVKDIPVDVFLQYQYSFGKDTDTTFLEYTKQNKYQGLSICPAQQGKFKRDESSEGIKYINEEGVEHPIKRTKWFAESNYAKQQKLSKSNTSSSDNPFANTQSEDSNPFF